MESDSIAFNHLYDWWGSEDLEASPYLQQIVDFLDTKEPEKRLASALMMLELNDPLVMGILVHDYTNADKYNQHELSERYLTSDYPEILHQRMLKTLKEPGRDSSFFSRANHADALEYLYLFFRQSDLDTLYGFLMQEQEYHYFHFHAFKAIHLYPLFHEQYKDTMLPLLRKLMYIEEQLLFMGSEEFTEKWEERSFYNKTALNILLHYRIDETIPLLDEFIKSDHFDVKTRLYSLNTMLRLDNDTIKYYLLDRLQEYMDVFILHGADEKEDLSKLKRIQFWLAGINENYLESFFVEYTHNFKFEKAKTEIEDIFFTIRSFEIMKLAELPLAIFYAENGNRKIKRVICKEIIFLSTRDYELFEAHKENILSFVKEEQIYYEQGTNIGEDVNDFLQTVERGLKYYAKRNETSGFTKAKWLKAWRKK